MEIKTGHSKKGQARGKGLLSLCTRGPTLRKERFGWFLQRSWNGVLKGSRQLKSYAWAYKGGGFLVPAQCDTCFFMRGVSHCIVNSHPWVWFLVFKLGKVHLKGTLGPYCTCPVIRIAPSLLLVCGSLWFASQGSWMPISGTLGQIFLWNLLDSSSWPFWLTQQQELSLLSQEEDFLKFNNENKIYLVLWFKRIHKSCKLYEYQ